MPPTRKKVRETIRQARRQVPERYRRQSALKFSTQIAGLEEYQMAASIAGYLPFDGEADPVPLLERAMLEGRSVYLPVMLMKGEPMKFAPYTRETPLKKNFLGIGEPDVSENEMVDADEIDFVVMPLVAFDNDCNRIGYGGGFYDLTFSFLNTAGTEHTSLFGLAFELQRLPDLSIRK
ncbi:MAG: 5-formyltetrahydrofolate cyclo-ligase [Planctomycetota bacterium]